MEPLWSPVVATGGKRWQISSARKPQEQAKTAAVLCDQLPEPFHGRRGSTVRVRQRASRKDPLSDVFVLAADPPEAREGTWRVPGEGLRVRQRGCCAGELLFARWLAVHPRSWTTRHESSVPATDKCQRQ